MDVLIGEEHVKGDGGGDGGRKLSQSSASNHSSQSPVSGFDSPDGLGAPEEYCKQVFTFCDPEGKGYITRETLSRCCDRRNSVLDSIMSTLDHDKDGRISFDEFKEGFESYSHDFLVAHGAHMSDQEEEEEGEQEEDKHEHHGDGVGDEEEPIPTDTMATGLLMSTPIVTVSESRQEDVWESDRRRSFEEDEIWAAMAEKIDPDDLLRGTEVGKVWSELANRDPSLLEHFERFLNGVTAELKQSQHDKEKLETHMKRAMDQHNREVMEMEDLLEQHLSEVHEDHQIKSATKTQQLSSRFHALLAARDQVIHQLGDKEDLLRKELQNKSRSEEILIEEKEGLLMANSLLKDQLDKSLRSMSLARRAGKSSGLKNLSRSATVDLDNSIEMRARAVPIAAAESPPVHYFPPKKSPRHLSPPTSVARALSHELAADSLDHTRGSSRESTPRIHREPADRGGEEASERKEAEMEISLDAQLEGFESRPPSRVMKKSVEETEANLHSELSQHDLPPSHKIPPPSSHDSHVTKKSKSTNSALSHLTNDILTYSNQVATAATTTTDDSVSQSTWLRSSRNDVMRPSSPMAVNRVFKVVFLGNSGVGKTSLIVRVSQGQFAPVHSTLGLDFSTKTLTVGNERIVFQLWDTAGQERFHNALTSVYFRRADAFIIVYDVTNRNSFKSVRSWLSIITASLREHPPVLMLVGNKCDSSNERRVTSEEGRQLALELHAMFSEMSALSGTNVMQAHQTLASLLLARENEELEKARKASLDINAQSQKRRCFC